MSPGHVLPDFVLKWYCDMLEMLQATFLRGTSALSSKKTENPSLAAELEELDGDRLDTRCRRNGLSKTGGRDMQVSTDAAMHQWSVMSSVTCACCAMSSCGCTSCVWGIRRRDMHDQRHASEQLMTQDAQATLCCCIGCTQTLPHVHQGAIAGISICNCSVGAAAPCSL